MNLGIFRGIEHRSGGSDEVEKVHLLRTSNSSTASLVLYMCYILLIPGRGHSRGQEWRFDFVCSGRRVERMVDGRT